MPEQINRIGEFAAGLQEHVRAALVAGAERIVDGAKERVPVDETAETHLRDAIHVYEDEEGVYVVAGNKEHWYGHMVEHGTTHSAPEPFLMPAFEEQADSIVQDVREALRRSV